MEHFAQTEMKPRRGDEGIAPYGEKRNMELPQRKRNRLPGHDYGQNGAYFITICTKDRECVLSDIVGDDALIVPKPIGQVVEKYICNAPEIEKYVIMPDHIHMIVRLDGGNQSRVTSIVRSIKTLTTKEVGEAVFQRSYYDHVIRNQEDYNEIWEYIENNPRKWAINKYGRR